MKLNILTRLSTSFLVTLLLPSHSINNPVHSDTLSFIAGCSMSKLISKKFNLLHGPTALLLASTTPIDTKISLIAEKQASALSQHSAVTMSSRYVTKSKPCDLKTYLIALASPWQHIAADLQPIGIVRSKYRIPCHFNPKKIPVSWVLIDFVMKGFYSSCSGTTANWAWRPLPVMRFQ